MIWNILQTYCFLGFGVFSNKIGKWNGIIFQQPSVCKFSCTRRRKGRTGIDWASAKPNTEARTTADDNFILILMFCRCVCLFVIILNLLLDSVFFRLDVSNVGFSKYFFCDLLLRLFRSYLSLHCVLEMECVAFLGFLRSSV